MISASAMLWLEAAVSTSTQTPIAITALNVGRNPFGNFVGQPAGKPPYEPLDVNGFRRRNGTSAHNYVLTSGAWWLLAGDQPSLCRVATETLFGAAGVTLKAP